MEKEFNVNILTVNSTVYKGQAVSLVVPAQLGYLGILANHAPLAANLVSGKISLREKTGNTRIFHSKEKGFLEIYQNNVNLLLDSVE